MITLKEWMEIVNYRITEGSDYNAYGGIGVYSLSSWNGDQDGYSMEIIFNTNTQEIYEAQACDYKHNRAYRLINQAHKQQPRDDEAWDSTKWIDLEEDDDWIQKALAIVAGEDYDTRVNMPLELDDDVLFKMMRMAHERDITLNQFVEQCLRVVIDQEQAKS